MKRLGLRKSGFTWMSLATIGMVFCGCSVSPVGDAAEGTPGEEAIEVEVLGPEELGQLEAGLPSADADLSAVRSAAADIEGEGIPKGDGIPGGDGIVIPATAGKSWGCHHYRVYYLDGPLGRMSEARVRCEDAKNQIIGSMVATGYFFMQGEIITAEDHFQFNVLVRRLGQDVFVGTFKQKVNMPYWITIPTNTLEGRRFLEAINRDLRNLKSTLPNIPLRYCFDFCNEALGATLACAKADQGSACRGPGPIRNAWNCKLPKPPVGSCSSAGALGGMGMLLPVLCYLRRRFQAC